jgi:hypothetical protein
MDGLLCKLRVDWFEALFSAIWPTLLRKKMAFFLKKQRYEYFVLYQWQYFESKLPIFTPFFSPK